MRVISAHSNILLHLLMVLRALLCTLFCYVPYHVYRIGGIILPVPHIVVLLLHYLY